VPPGLESRLRELQDQCIEPPSAKDRRVPLLSRVGAIKDTATRTLNEEMMLLNNDG
jgi:hypothetical protein